MAKITGPHKYKGKLGPLVAYITKDGENIVQSPGGPSKKQVKTDPAYETFRQSTDLNSLASRTGKSIRLGFGLITDRCKDGSLWDRLSITLRQVLRSHDSTPVKAGTVPLYNHTLLDGLQWNARSALENVFDPDHATYIDPATGVTDIIISSFSPADVLRPPEDATHFIIVTAALSFLPGGQKSPADIQQSQLIPCNAPNVPAINIRLHPDAKKSSIILAGIGIIFYGQVRRKFKALPESAFVITKTYQIASP